MNRFVLLIGLLLSAPAWSADIDSIAGSYRGKVFDAKGIPGERGESCDVTIIPQPNSVQFKVGGAFAVAVENEVVTKGLARGKPKVRLETFAKGGGRIFVVLKLRAGIPHFIRLRVAGHKRRDTLACSELKPA